MRIRKFRHRISTVILFFLLHQNVSAITIFDYLEQALVKIIVQATYMGLASYDYVGGSSMFGAFLEKGGSKSINVQFTANEDYLIMGAGDDDIYDLDLCLYYGNRLLQKDEESDATPILSYTPYLSGQYKISMSNYNSYQAGFCLLVILKYDQRGGNFQVQEIAEALDNLLRLAKYIDAISSSTFTTDTFCLFGGKLSSGSEQYIYNTKLSSKEYIMLGAGSNQVLDVNVSAIRQGGLNEKNGRTVSSGDELWSNIAACSFVANPYSYYKLNYENASLRDGFVFVLLLEL